MKQLLITIAAVVLVGCGESQQSATAPEAEPIEPLAEAKKTEPAKADISLIEAAKAGNIEAVEQHLAAGSDVNAKDNNELTPLHWAAREGRKEVAELLISKGAEVNIQDKSRNTPLTMAILWEAPKVADLLRKHGAKTALELALELKADESIHTAVFTGQIEVVKKHLAAGTDVNERGAFDRTPLLFGPTKEIVELLIAKGADVNAKDDAGITPLHWAGTKEIAELLIANGAYVNAMDDGAETPLDCAIEEGHTEIADLLRKHGGKTYDELKAAGN